ncbi:hypothetical protein B0T19DRAFT_421376 [Cercophora scortea]|uniref:Uncharacterized protein n=1 Tax=Cercophora scortea TaxID=314031 RepID=A0AAE0ILR1_9PEZI|nr:hypothetical protein B0T19DRAFT_421376 [Cercophora scortea]
MQHVHAWMISAPTSLTQLPSSHLIFLRLLVPRWAAQPLENGGFCVTTCAAQKRPSTGIRPPKGEMPGARSAGGNDGNLW